MKLAILGPPGSGKGTQSPLLCKSFGILHISTGDILRSAIREGSALGLEAEDYLLKGQLVPDGVMIRIVKERISKQDCSKGFLLDGFPRTIPQARMLDELDLGPKMGKATLDFVISLELSEKECIRRITNRRTCPKCGLTYNPLTHPSREAGKCDACHSTLILRPDDKPETVRERLKVYHELTQPLVRYYQSSDRLVLADASSTPDQVFKNLLDLVKSEVNGRMLERSR